MWDHLVPKVAYASKSGSTRPQSRGPNGILPLKILQNLQILHNLRSLRLGLYPISVTRLDWMGHKRNHHRPRCTPSRAPLASSWGLSLDPQQCVHSLTGAC